ALGHIHRPQKVGSNPWVRYSGSRILSGFDEENTRAEVTAVGWGGGEALRDTSLPIPLHQARHVEKGNLQHIATELEQVQAPEHVPTVWLELQVTDDGYLTDLQQRLERVLEDKPVEVLRIMRVQEAAQAQLQSEAQETLAELS